MRLRVFGSGSKGNALAIRSGGTLLLLDCGFSCRELEKRMTDAERSIDSIIYTLMPPLKENRAPIGFRQAAKTSQSA